MKNSDTLSLIKNFDFEKYSSERKSVYDNRISGQGKFEEKAIKKLLKKIDQNTYSLDIYYTSPQGRNHYHDVRYIPIPELQNRILETEKYEALKKSERNKMSASIRLKVLTRDKFTCQYCGAKAPNVELHVDHIIPIAKGGKTVLSNLQTLCSECNLAKSDNLM